MGGNTQILVKFLKFLPEYILDCTFYFFILIFFLVFKKLKNLFINFTATPAAYGSSQARFELEPQLPAHGHSHSTTRSESHLRPTLQLGATLDP